ncbi:retrovirus-related Pol polyprotein from transposon 412 [Trichonephila clavipes]|nr:retrovirus-related Pol polyprotein from transposon 412 [Trichonephila clavipes]
MFVCASTGTMCGVTRKSVAAHLVPVLYAKVPENAPEEDCSCIIGSSEVIFICLQIFCSADPPDEPLMSEEYIEKLQAWMEEMHHLVRERISMASEKMKTRYVARETGHDFREGDKVWLWNPKQRRKGLSPKLQMK